MRKLYLILIILTAFLSAKAQNTVTVPFGSASGVAKFRTTGTLTDSLNKRYFIIFDGGAYNELYTATYIRKNFLSIVAFNDSLAAHTAAFDRNFRVVADSIHLADTIRIKSALLIGINTIPAWDAGYKVLSMAGNVGLRSQVGGHNMAIFTNLYNTDGSSTWHYAANGYGSDLYLDEGGGINFYSVASGTAGGTVVITKPIWSVTRNGATLTTMRDTTTTDTIVGYKNNGELVKIPFSGGGGGAFLPLNFTSFNRVNLHGNSFNIEGDNASGGTNILIDSLDGVNIYTSDAADAVNSRYVQNSDGATLTSTDGSVTYALLVKGATGAELSETSGSNKKGLFIVDSENGEKITDPIDHYGLFHDDSIDRNTWTDESYVDKRFLDSTVVANPSINLGNTDLTVTTGGGLRSVTLNGNEVDWIGSYLATDVVTKMWPTGDVGIHVSSSQSDNGYALYITNSGVNGMLSVGELQVDGTGHLQVTTKSPHDNSNSPASTAYVDAAVTAGVGGAANLYNTDGTLTGNRALHNSGHTLKFDSLQVLNVPVNPNGVVRKVDTSVWVNNVVAVRAINIGLGTSFSSSTSTIGSPLTVQSQVLINENGGGRLNIEDGNNGKTWVIGPDGTGGAPETLLFRFAGSATTKLKLDTSTNGQLFDGAGVAYAKAGSAFALTTTGTSGVATYASGTLNIPQYAGSTGANPTGSIGFTAVNGSAGTFTRSDGAAKADSAVIRSVANSYSLSGMQTKLNNYALTSALPIGANPTASAGAAAVNGVATTFMRSDGAPKVDSAVFRSVANSRTLAQTQTALNLKLNVSDTASFAGNLVHINGAETVLGPKTFNKVITETTNALGATTTAGGLITQNTTAATSTVSQVSTAVQGFGRAWNTTSLASVPVGFSIWSKGTNGNPPSGIVNIDVIVNGVTSNLVTLNNASGAAFPANISAGTQITANSFIRALGIVQSGLVSNSDGSFVLAGSTSGLITIKGTALTTGTYSFVMPTTAGTAGQMLTSQAGGTTAMTWSDVSTTKASADLTAQSAAGNVTTFTVGASTATFNISSYINVTAVSVDVIQGQITYTDENNTAQTVSLANISAIGNSTYSPITIRAKNATVITVKTNLTTGAGTITFDAGARITQL